MSSVEPETVVTQDSLALHRHRQHQCPASKCRRPPHVAGPANNPDSETRRWRGSECEVAQRVLGGTNRAETQSAASLWPVRRTDRALIGPSLIPD
jgi:hypothetical protein